MVESPLIGFGSTRSTMGGRNSIAVGAEQRLRALRQLHDRRQRPTVATVVRARPARHRVVSGLLPVRPVAVPARPQRDRHRRFGRDRGEPRRDVLVQRAGHAAGLDLLRIRPAVEEPRRCRLGRRRRTCRPTMRQLRAEYVREVLALLYPGAGRRVPGTEYVLVPDARRPRLLVPADDRRVAAAAVARYAEPQSRLARLKRDAVVAALRTGASAALLRDRVTAPGGRDTIETYLRDALGTDVRLGVHIGPARANRKPVLQVLTPAGETVAFVKLGVNELTRGLVKAEAAALVTLQRCAAARRRACRKLLHSGQWRGHEVLRAGGAAGVGAARAAPTGAAAPTAMHAVATACGISSGTLGGSGYWTRLLARAGRGRRAPGRVPARPRRGPARHGRPATCG